MSAYVVDKVIPTLSVKEIFAPECEFHFCCWFANAGTVLHAGRMHGSAIVTQRAAEYIRGNEDHLRSQCQPSLNLRVILQENCDHPSLILRKKSVISCSASTLQQRKCSEASTNPCISNLVHLKTKILLEGFGMAR